MNEINYMEDMCILRMSQHERPMTQHHKKILLKSFDGIGFDMWKT